jgi:xanthine dehydrogenase accessory factor
MKEVIQEIQHWFAQGHEVAIATVVAKAGSSPRELGAVLAVSDAGEVAGSVSGGCVESAVVDEAIACLADGTPRLLSYGITDELGLSIGLTCGGTTDIFVDRLQPGLFFDRLVAAIRNQSAFALCTVVSGPNIGAKTLIFEDSSQPAIASRSDSTLDPLVDREAKVFLTKGLTQLRDRDDLEECDPGETKSSKPPLPPPLIRGVGGDLTSLKLPLNVSNTQTQVFIQSFLPPPRLIIIGAIDFSSALCQVGKLLGYHVTICDARSRFATVARFPQADQVEIEWPHHYIESTPIDARTAIVVLTHDPKFDIPALRAAVRTTAGYIGAIGSRRTHSDRVRRLQEIGMDPGDMARISSPIGLDIGANTPEETAVSIFAEIIALRSGRQGGRLTGGNQAIHPR